jgi:hypothetical protein
MVDSERGTPGWSKRINPSPRIWSHDREMRSNSSGAASDSSNPSQRAVDLSSMLENMLSVLRTCLFTYQLVVLIFF